MSRDGYRQQIVEAQDQVSAILYAGDGIHRLAKAVEMLLDPEEVAAKRSKHDDGPAVAIPIEQPKAAASDLDELDALLAGTDFTKLLDGLSDAGQAVIREGIRDHFGEARVAP